MTSKRERELDQEVQRHANQEASEVVLDALVAAAPHLPLDPHNRRNYVTGEGAAGYEVTAVMAPLEAIRNGATLMRTTFPDIEWHLPNLIPEGFTFVVGGPKIGKTHLTQHHVLAASIGGAILTETLVARPVLHLALEDSERRLKSRAVRLGYGTDDLARWEYLTRLPADCSARTLIRAWLDALPSLHPAPLVVIDTLGRVKGARLATESPYDHDYRVGVAMKDLADSVAGMALVVVHHDRKAQSPDFVDDVSGTNGLAGAADTIVLVRRERTRAEGVLLVTGRDVAEAAYAVTFDDGRWSLNGGSWETARDTAAEVAAMTGRGETATRIVAWLAQNVAGTPAQIAAALGADSNTIRQSLYRLFTARQVDRDGGSYFLPGKAPTPTTPSPAHPTPRSRGGRP